MDYCREKLSTCELHKTMHMDLKWTGLLHPVSFIQDGFQRVSCQGLIFPLISSFKRVVVLKGTWTWTSDILQKNAGLRPALCHCKFAFNISHLKSLSFMGWEQIHRVIILTSLDHWTDTFSGSNPRLLQIVKSLPTKLTPWRLRLVSVTLAMRGVDQFNQCNLI